MPWPVHPNGLLGAQGDNDSYRIERSLRFNTADSAYLNRTPASAGNRKTWTWSGWVKRGTLGGNNVFMGNTDASGYNGLYFQFDTNNNITIGDYGVGSYVWVLKTSQVFRDTSSWYHIVATFDSTQATASDRVSVYINGTKITAFSTATYPSLNLDGRINSTQLTSIGRLGSYNGFYFDGHITEINFIDGQALTQSSFGETDAVTGRWKAKAYSGTYGTNGFYLKFADNSGTTSTTLGKDSSPNGNNWTPNNLSVTAGAGNDSLVDSPTNYGIDTGVGGSVRGNYCTLNTLDKGSEATIANGGLDITWSGVSGHSARSTYAISSGKWYWEVTAGANASIGIIQSNIYPSLNQWPGNSAYGATGSYAYAPDGRKVNNSSYASYGSAFSNGNVIGVAYDATNGKIFFSLNGTWQASGDPVAGTNSAYSGISGEYSPAIGYWQSPASNVNSLNFGQRPFAYTAPTGFKALCTTNLPTPTIKKPSSYFDVVTRTSDGASNYTKTGLGFSPSLIWTKDRTSAYDHVLWDSVRGATKYISSNTTGTEQTAGQLASFNSDGYTINYGMGQANFSTDRYVDWIWEAASSSVTNNSGSITSTVRAYPLAGFSICTFNVGASGAKTFGHGLNAAPRMVIVKSRTSALGWTTYHASVITATNQYIQLNTTSAILSVAGIWGSALPTSSVVGIGSGTNVNANDDCVAYCFAEVEGYSKFGSYTGNASTDGPFVYCGFRPKFIIVKRTDTAGEPWIIKDTSRSSYNGNDVELYANTSAAEGGPYSPPIMDYVSNGFKLRSTATGSNASGATYIFMAFAESPFKYSRAR